MEMEASKRDITNPLGYHIVFQSTACVRSLQMQVLPTLQMSYRHSFQ